MCSNMLPSYFKNIKLTTNQENIRKMMKSCSRGAAAGDVFTLDRWRMNLIWLEQLVSFCATFMQL